MRAGTKILTKERVILRENNRYGSGYCSYPELPPTRTHKTYPISSQLCRERRQQQRWFRPSRPQPDKGNGKNALVSGKASNISNRMQRCLNYISNYNKAVYRYAKYLIYLWYIYIYLNFNVFNVYKCYPWYFKWYFVNCFLWFY